MKKFLLICWLGTLATNVWAQRSTIVRLQAAVRSHPQADTGRVNLLNALALSQYATAPQQTIAAYQEALPLARKLHYASGEAVALLGMGFYHRFRNEYGPALTYTLQAQQVFRRLGDQLNEVKCRYNLSYTELGQGHFAQSMAHSLAGLRLAEAMPNQHWTTLVYSQLGNTCLQMGEYDKARHYLLRGLRLAEPVGDKSGIGHCVLFLADLCRQQGRWAEARRYYQQGLGASEKGTADMNRGITLSLLQIGAMAERMGHYREAFATEFRVLRRMQRLHDVGSLPEAQVILARAYLHTGRPDSALVYGQESLRAAQRGGIKSIIRDASEVLAQASAQLSHFAEAYRYHVVFTAYKDSLSSQDLSRRTAALQYTYELDKKQSQIQLLTRNEQLSRQKNRQQQQLLFGTLAGLGVVAGLSLLLWRNNRQKQRANAQLLRQQQELKATQAQLIQKEKMASLGELTAGIAHEIQNPLNFVNNFADVSTELITELEQAQAAGEGEEVVALAADVRQNLVKITQHGQRAASIVRGMLEHSRASTGERAPTDINALADEYLRLAYQGLRAKDKTFNAALHTDFTPALPLVQGVGADLGRVLLNLFNNAFYAVQQRQLTGEPGYAPTVSVQTEQVGKQVHIRVSDNGTGMSPEVQAKIFQPFFTTKPTGEGTGLGLSLAHDIIVQGHGGTLTVESQPGQGAVFAIRLPLQ